MPCLQVLGAGHCCGVYGNVKMSRQISRFRLEMFQLADAASVFLSYLTRMRLEPQLPAGYEAADVCCRAFSPGTGAGRSFNLTVSAMRDLKSAGFWFLVLVCHPAPRWSILVLCSQWSDSFETK